MCSTGHAGHVSNEPIAFGRRPVNTALGGKMDAETFKSEAAVFLKRQGFKKRGGTWWRSQVESVAVFNVQKSQWGGGVSYINVGTYFRALGGEESPPAYRCHVQARLDVGDPSTVVQVALAWFEQRERLQDARTLAESDDSKGLVFKELRYADAA
jgi:hypothetical protein